ncbi:MAG: hypothetical protein WCR96_06105 [Candidatus Methanomethylophilaceae archaeon]
MKKNYNMTTSCSGCSNKCNDSTDPNEHIDVIVPPRSTQVEI